MTSLKPKISTTIKPSSQTCTIKSILQPDLNIFDKNRISIIWYRQPPPPYEIEELTHNFNQLSYRCSSLDYECVILCKVYGQRNAEVARFDYGPVQTFVYTRLSTSLELWVYVLLFGVWKKCLFVLGTVPTLINPQNNNKYQLTQQDIRSIFLKHQPLLKPILKPSDDPPSETLPILSNQLKKTIVIENLFQRLILLKLFHEIPNGMYCYSMEVLEIAFYDESAVNMALLAINRFKYQKREVSDVSKSIYNQPTQELALNKMIKKSNDSLTHLKGEFPPSGPFKNDSEDTLKKEFLPLSAFTNWRKSPKQSINSVNESSIMSGNSNKANEIRTSLFPRTLEISRNVGQSENREGLTSKGSSEYISRVSIKQPKISILSTDINSTKQREQKPSFPQNPPVTQTLKSSQLIIKPKQFNSSLSLRRSQEQIKTPRLDIDNQTLELSSVNFPGPIKKKSASDIEIPNQNEETEEKDHYVNQFENLLFEAGEEDNNEAELCLNDSFAKLQEEEEKEKNSIMQSPPRQLTSSKTTTPQNILQIIPSSSPITSQSNVLSLKQALRSVLQQNYDLKLKNEDLKKQIFQAKTNGDKKNEIEKYEGEIQKMREIQSLLVREIDGLKRSVIMSNSQVVDRSKGSNSWISRTIQKEKMSFSFTRLQDGKKPEAYKFMGSLFSPPRQSKAAQQRFFKPTEPLSPSFITRRSQEHDPSSFGIPQAVESSQQTDQKNIVFDSGDLKFMKFQQDPEYQKFRNNQSYSYKQTDTMKLEEKKGVKEYQKFKY